MKILRSIMDRSFEGPSLKCNAGPFAQITQGPQSPTGQNPNHQALVFDRASNIVEAVGDGGLAQALQTCLFSLPAQAPLSTITTAQNLINVTLNKNVLNKLNRILEVSGEVVFTNPAGTPQITIAVSLGGVALVSIQSAATGSGATNMPINFAFVLAVASTGSAGTIESHGQINIEQSTTVATAIASFLDGNSAVSAAVNLTSALALTVTIAATSTVTSATLRQAQIELIF